MIEIPEGSIPFRVYQLEQRADKLEKGAVDVAVLQERVNTLAKEVRGMKVAAWSLVGSIVVAMVVFLMQTGGTP